MTSTCRRIFLPAGFAILLLLFGSVECWRLAQSYRTLDILYRETPETFLTWMAEAFAARPDNGTVVRIARRLQLTRPVVRRDIVADLVAGGGLAKLAAQSALRLERLAILLAATELALREAPASAELWILATAIRARVVGIDARTVEGLRLSRTLAPRELDLVLLRLNLARTTWLALSQSDRQAVAEDFAVLTAAAPEQASAVREALMAAGIDLLPITQ